MIAATIRYGTARQNSRAKPVERQVRVSANELSSDGVTVPRAKIASGRYQPRVPRSTVQLFDRQSRIVFEAEVATEEQGIALLRALGLDASQKRAEFRTVSPLLESQARAALFLGVTAALAAVVMRLITPEAGHMFPFVVLPLLAVAAIPRKLVVGRDGLLVRWMGTRRFIPMSEIVTATAQGETSIRLELAGGKEETLFLHSPKRRGGIFTQYRDAVLARIREAHASHEAKPAADLTALVAQGGRTKDEWKKSLVSIEESAPDYRKAAIRPEDLWRVVEDPRAEPDARAGAAVLLRKGLDEAGKARVRVAAAATASPQLRVALEATLDESDSDEALLDALDDVALKTRR